jgi:hypothetical protein
MTTLLVNINDEQEERALLDFLNSHKYNYVTETQPTGLSEAQKTEILRREEDFKAGKIKSEPRKEVRKRFLRSWDFILKYLKQLPMTCKFLMIGMRNEEFSEKYRFALLKRLVYNIEEDENLVNVTAVFHTSRDPERF